MSTSPGGKYGTGIGTQKGGGLLAANNKIFFFYQLSTFKTGIMKLRRYSYNMKNVLPENICTKTLLLLILTSKFIIASSGSNFRIAQAEITSKQNYKIVRSNFY